MHTAYYRFRTFEKNKLITGAFYKTFVELLKGNQYTGAFFCANLGMLVTVLGNIPTVGSNIVFSSLSEQQHRYPLERATLKLVSDFILDALGTSALGMVYIPIQVGSGLARTLRETNMEVYEKQKEELLNDLKIGKSDDYRRRMLIQSQISHLDATAFLLRTLSIPSEIKDIAKDWVCGIFWPNDGKSGGKALKDKPPMIVMSNQSKLSMSPEEIRDSAKLISYLNYTIKLKNKNNGSANSGNANNPNDKLKLFDINLLNEVRKLSEQDKRFNSRFNGDELILKPKSWLRNLFNRVQFNSSITVNTQPAEWRREIRHVPQTAIVVGRLEWYYENFLTDMLSKGDHPSLLALDAAHSILRKEIGALRIDDGLVTLNFLPRLFDVISGEIPLPLEAVNVSENIWRSIERITGENFETHLNRDGFDLRQVEIRRVGPGRRLLREVLDIQHQGVRRRLTNLIYKGKINFNTNIVRAFDVALAYYRREDYKTAILCFQSLMRNLRGGYRDYSNFLIANAYLSQNNFGEAGRYYKILLSKNKSQTTESERKKTRHIINNKFKMIRALLRNANNDCTRSIRANNPSRAFNEYFIPALKLMIEARKLDEYTDTGYYDCFNNFNILLGRKYNKIPNIRNTYESMLKAAQTKKETQLEKNIRGAFQEFDDFLNSIGLVKQKTNAMKLQASLFYDLITQDDSYIFKAKNTDHIFKCTDVSAMWKNGDFKIRRIGEVFSGFPVVFKDVNNKNIYWDGKRIVPGLVVMDEKENTGFFIRITNAQFEVISLTSGNLILKDIIPVNTEFYPNIFESKYLCMYSKPQPLRKNQSRSADNKGWIKVWDLKNKKKCEELKNLPNRIGKFVVTNMYIIIQRRAYIHFHPQLDTHTLCIYSMQTKQLIKEIKFQAPRGGGQYLYFTTNKQRLFITGLRGGVVQVWDLKTLSILASHRRNDVRSNGGGRIPIILDDKYMISWLNFVWGQQFARIDIWDATLHRLLGSIPGINLGVFNDIVIKGVKHKSVVIIQPNPYHYDKKGMQHSLQIWDLDTRQRLPAPKGFSFFDGQPVFQKHGNLLLSYEAMCKNRIRKRRIRIWDMQKFECIRTIDKDIGDYSFLLKRGKSGIETGIIFCTLGTNRKGYYVLQFDAPQFRKQFNGKNKNHHDIFDDMVIFDTGNYTPQVNNDENRVVFRQYEDRDISTYLRVFIGTVGGYRPDCNFLLNGIGNNHTFPEYNEDFRYFVAITPAIDTMQQASPVDFYLDKANQRAPIEGRRDDRRDVFDELRNIIRANNNCHIKILFPYNITQNHWLTGEIKIHKRGHRNQIEVYAHDPFGRGDVNQDNYTTICNSIRRRIRAIDPQAETNFNMRVSPYAAPRQRHGDGNSCGVIVASDITKRITGETLNVQQPNLFGSPRLRLEQIQMVERLHDNQDEIKHFLGRNAGAGYKPTKKQGTKQQNKKCSQIKK